MLQKEEAKPQGDFIDVQIPPIPTIIGAFCILEKAVSIAFIQLLSSLLSLSLSTKSPEIFQRARVTPEIGLGWNPGDS
jgi:hypothetical protein